tara:strand:+ start:1458 stop:1628 length:171 start_codon:yes stop_codon:yes gene_type:complete
LLCERTSLIATPNLAFGECSSAFGDVKLTTALFDCLPLHYNIVEADNEIQRFKTQA